MEVLFNQIPNERAGKNRDKSGEGIHMRNSSCETLCLKEVDYEMKTKSDIISSQWRRVYWVMRWKGLGWGQCNYDYKVSYLNRVAIHKRGVRREGRKYKVHKYACDFLKYLNHFDKARPSGYF